MLPSIFRDNLFDDMFDFDFDKEFNRMMRPLYGKHAQNMMKTDVRETDNSYELDIDLPGFKKDEISVQLDNGYLSISASKGLDKDEENKNGKYIRRERYASTRTSTRASITQRRMCFLAGWAACLLVFASFIPCLSFLAEVRRAPKAGPEPLIFPSSAACSCR